MSEKELLKFSEADPGIVVDEFTNEEVEMLNPFVTDVNSNVFAWKISNEFTPEQAGALLARYSRSSLLGKRIFLKEFLPNKDRGKEFFDAWLVDYGDDSVQEMAGGLPVACEFVSNLAVKEIEDSRLASYIEKSTRYVFFDKKLPDGEYMFYKSPEIMQSQFANEYVELMHSLFDSYVKYTPLMIAYLKEKYPIEKQTFLIGKKSISITELTPEIEKEYGIGEREIRNAYENAIKANALDLMRDYLPMATLTHLGISANARSYENIVIKLLSSPLEESRWIGKRLQQELLKVAPSLLKRTTEQHGMEFVEFMRGREEKTRKSVSEILSKKGVKPESSYENSVKLVDYTGKQSGNADEEAKTAVATAILYRFGSGQSIEQARKIAEEMDGEERDRLIAIYVSERGNRRHKPGRAFENIDYTFDFEGNVGIYRDLQRHRIGTQERQNFTTFLGYNERKEFEEIGILEDYRSKMEAVDRLFRKMYEVMPYQAQYVVTFGFRVRWYHKMNAREFFHFAELRTSPQGHPDYRKLVQQAFREVEEVHPSIAKYAKFVNMSDAIELGRLNSEIRIAQKRNTLARKVA